jgi:uncharacterized membrane protein
MTLLVIGFAAILVALVAVVVDASQVMLLRRSLSSLADGAALAGAQAASERVVYTQGPGDVVPLDPIAARTAVVDYLAGSGAGGVDGLRLVGVAVEAGRVTVTLAAPADLAIVNVVTAAADGTIVTARASALSPVS